MHKGHICRIREQRIEKVPCTAYFTRIFTYLLFVVIAHKNAWKRLGRFAEEKRYNNNGKYDM